MQVMNVYDSSRLLKFSFYLSGSFSTWCRFHNNVVTIFDDRNCRADNNYWENVCWNWIKVMPIIPLFNWSTFVRTQEENEQWWNQKTNTLNDISWNKIKIYIKREERQLSYLYFRVVHDEHVSHDYDHDHGHVHGHACDHDYWSPCGHGHAYILLHVYVNSQLWVFRVFNENVSSFMNVYVEVLLLEIVHNLAFYLYQDYDHACNFIHVYVYDHWIIHVSAPACGHDHDDVNVNDTNYHFSYQL